MSSLPLPLKRLLLPLWNGGHRLAWRAGEYLDAIHHRRFERCSVCGKNGPILYRRWVVPPKLEALWGLSPRLAEALARKESSECSRCGAKLRARRLASVLLGHYPVGKSAAPSISVRRWVRSREARKLRVAEINLVDGLHRELSRLPGHRYSEFVEGAAPGSTVDGVRSEDLTRLTYPDASIDLVLTSETLEHVPDLARALSEIRRVLVPEGLHLFTVPLLPGVPTTHARTTVWPDGQVTHHSPPIRHPGGDSGYPVFTEFGADFPEILRQAGFKTEVHFGPPTEDDLAQVFACRRSP